MGRIDESCKQRDQRIIGIRAVETVRLKDRKWYLERGMLEIEVLGIWCWVVCLRCVHWQRVAEVVLKMRSVERWRSRN